MRDCEKQSPLIKVNSVARKQSLGMVVVAVFLTLTAYQFEPHGLWGKMVNYNKEPNLNLTRTGLTPATLNLGIYRPNGPDTYGSFIVSVAIADSTNRKLIELGGLRQLAHVLNTAIRNIYHFQKISHGPWGFVVPLSAKGIVHLPLSTQAKTTLSHTRRVTVTVADVSGLKWVTRVPRT